jgi:hypothetical protein
VDNYLFFCPFIFWPMHYMSFVYLWLDYSFGIFKLFCTTNVMLLNYLFSACLPVGIIRDNGSFTFYVDAFFFSITAKIVLDCIYE